MTPYEYALAVEQEAISGLGQPTVGTIVMVLLAQANDIGSTEPEDALRALACRALAETRAMDWRRTITAARN